MAENTWSRVGTSSVCLQVHTSADVVGVPAHVHACLFCVPVCPYLLYLYAHAYPIYISISALCASVLCIQARRTCVPVLCVQACPVCVPILVLYVQACLIYVPMPTPRYIIRHCLPVLCIQACPIYVPIPAPSKCPSMPHLCAHFCPVLSV